MKNNRIHYRIIVLCLAACLIALSIVPSVTAGSLINLDRSPLSQSVLIKGDSLTISGNVSGISELRIWIFGPKYANATTMQVEPDGSFTYSLTSREIEGMESGNYTVILQSPGDDLTYEIALDNKTGEVINTSIPFSNPDRMLYTLAQAKNMYGTDAPDALVRTLNNSAVDDSYAVYGFSIEDPFIELDPVRDYYVGETVTISGRTNLPVGEQILIEFGRKFMDYGKPGDLVRQPRTVTIEPGLTGINYFSAEFNSGATRTGQQRVVCVSPNPNIQ